MFFFLVIKYFFWLIVKVNFYYVFGDDIMVYYDLDMLQNGIFIWDNWGLKLGVIFCIK